MINNWQKKFFKIKYLKQENKDNMAVRNLGLENSDGDLIAFIDSDCEADINWLDIIYESYKKNNFDACGGPDGSKENFTILQKAIDYSMTSFFTTGGMRGHSKKMMLLFILEPTIWLLKNHYIKKLEDLEVLDMAKILNLVIE